MEIQIQDYLYQLPTKPSDHLIHGYSKKPLDTFWLRIPEPEYMQEHNIKRKSNGKPVYTSQQDAYIEQEYERRIDGFWFFNKGEPSYITGDHYFLLQWWKMPKTIYAPQGFAQFRMFQRDHYYFLDFCDKDPECFGALTFKPRRTGITEEENSRIANASTYFDNSNFGMMNKTSEDAQKVNFLPIVKGINNLSEFFRPISRGSSSPKLRMEFSLPEIRQTRQNMYNKRELFNPDIEVLNNVVDWRSTVEDSYDGHLMKRFVMDEASKWGKECDPYQTWKIIKLAQTLDTVTIVGKAHILSSSDEEDSPSFESWKRMYAESNINKKSELGRTVSGLYRYFIKAQTCYAPCIDKYGYCDEVEADKRILADRETVKHDKKALMIKMRQSPRNIDEALNLGGGQSTFDNIRIGLRLERIEVMPELPYKVGNLVWQNNIPDSKVRFIETPHGRWKIAQHPRPDRQNYVKKHGNVMFMPYMDTEFVEGADPIDYDDTIEEGSKAASHVFKKFNYFQTGSSNIFVSQYLARPESSDLFYEDMIKQTFYFGAMMNPERRNIGIFKYFERRGYGAFLMFRPNETKVAYSKNDVLKGTPATLRITQLGIECIDNYYAPPQNETDIDYLELFPFEETLIDNMKFVMSDTKKSDLTMSQIYTLIAAGELKQVNLGKINKEANELMGALFHDRTTAASSENPSYKGFGKNINLMRRK